VEAAAASPATRLRSKSEGRNLGPKIGANQSGFFGGFFELSDAESIIFHLCPNQIQSVVESCPKLLSATD